MMPLANGLFECRDRGIGERIVPVVGLIDGVSPPCPRIGGRSRGHGEGTLRRETERVLVRFTAQKMACRRMDYHGAAVCSAARTDAAKCRRSTSLSVYPVAH